LVIPIDGQFSVSELLLVFFLLQLAMLHTLISVEALRDESLQGEWERTWPSFCLCPWALAVHPTWLCTWDLMLSKQGIKNHINKVLEQLCLAQQVRVSFHHIRHLGCLSENAAEK
jgi:hypothetical protein